MHTKSLHKYYPCCCHNSAVSRKCFLVFLPTWQKRSTLGEIKQLMWFAWGAREPRKELRLLCRLWGSQAPPPKVSLGENHMGAGGTLTLLFWAVVWTWRSQPGQTAAGLSDGSPILSVYSLLGLPVNSPIYPRLVKTTDFFFSVFNLFILYWGTANFQRCGSFRWTPEGHSPTCTYIHSPPASPPIQAATHHWAEFLVLYSRSLWVVIYFFNIAVCTWDTHFDFILLMESLTKAALMKTA